MYSSFILSKFGRHLHGWHNGTLPKASSASTVRSENDDLFE
jgi:hypothetical protein